jgi:hypothetical protein
MDDALALSSINQIVAEALATAQARRSGFLASLNLEGRVFDTATGEPASALSRQALHQAIAEVAADGVLTDREREHILGFLKRTGLTLIPTNAALPPIDFDGIELPDIEP